MRNLNLLLSGSRGFLLAHLLGPAGYGVLGGLIALQQMLSYAALGMREGVAIRLAKLPGDGLDVVGTYSSSIAFAMSVGLLLPCTAVIYSVLAFSHVDGNYLLVALIGGVTVLNEVLININRHEGHLLRISICEISYNLLILVLVLVFHHYLSVTLVLVYMLLAISCSATVYLTRLRFFSLAAVAWRSVRSLLSIGFQSSILSALTVVLNLLFILVAKRHLPQAQVGELVFANNVATVIMVSLNAFSWAMTSRSLSDLAGAHDEERRQRRLRRTDMYLELGVAGALLAAMAMAVALPWVTERYADSSHYVLLFVGLQSFQLLIFTELNYLMINNRIPVLIGLFALANGIDFAMVELLSGRLDFHVIMILAIVCIALTTSLVIRYAANMGLSGVDAAAKYVSMLAVVVAVVLFYGMGVAVALFTTLAFLAFLLVSNRNDLPRFGASRA